MIATCVAFFSALPEYLSDKTIVHAQAFVVYIALLPVIAGIAWLSDVACRSDDKPIKRN